MVEVGEAVAVPFPAEGIGLEASGSAVGAGDVGTVAGEEDADVHLVGVLFQPVEEAFDAVPALAVPIVFGWFGAKGGFAEEDEVALSLGELVEGLLGGNFEAFAGADEVVLALAVDLAFEGADCSVVDRLRHVGDGEAVVDFDDASEAAAFGAGSKGGVEGKDGRTGWAVGLV